VPIYAINATTPQHIQSGTVFASQHDLRIAVKSSGHDYLGRSTARGSLLLWTHYFQDITFTDDFVVGGKSLGSALTVGSGVDLTTIYQAAKAQGKMVVGGSAATVCAGGGYTQGAGHSAFSPTFGLAADNMLEYTVVLADGSYVTVNDVSNSDLFWALRGGGAGSWGVIISATMRTFPIFSASVHTANFLFNSSNMAAEAMAVHARHIFDYDTLRGSQYYTVSLIGNGSFSLQTDTYFVNITADEAAAAVAPFIGDVQAIGVQLINQTAITGLANDLVTSLDDLAGFNALLGSRLIPATAFQDNPEGIGAAYKMILDHQDVLEIIGIRVAGGKVAENANVNNAVLPKWRTAKSHVIAVVFWEDSTSASDVELIKQNLTTNIVPVLAAVTGESDSGAYSNEADVREPNFQVTFFGKNYARLSAIKAKYDPKDMFIVGAGVGSERWDSAGMCTASS